MSITKKIAIGASACLMAVSLTACGSEPASHASSLANLNYRSGRPAWVKVHHDKSTLNPRSWKYDHVHYAKLDHENRTSYGNTGWLERKNVANDSGRTRQIVKPTGWHQKFNGQGEPIINRGHEIAYSLSKGIAKSGKYDPKLNDGDQNNLKNLFTQTAFSNQEVQTIFESKVRNALKHNEKVIYQVKPIFKGRDLMAKGVQMQAISTNHKLDFDVYLYNVQPGYRFNYLTGRSFVDRTMKVPTPKGAPHFHDNGQAVPNRNWSARYHKAYGRERSYRYRPRYVRYRGHYRHHHFVRDYMIYRIGKHVIRHHIARHRYYRYY